MTPTARKGKALFKQYDTSGKGTYTHKQTEIRVPIIAFALLLSKSAVEDSVAGTTIVTTQAKLSFWSLLGSLTSPGNTSSG